MNKLIFGFATLFLLGISSCKKVGELKENITSAEDYVLMETEYMALFEMVTDACANSKNLGGVEASNSLPSGVFSVQDSLLSDGDGLEFTLDFGKMKSIGKKGVYCYDGKYRAGKLLIKMDKYYGSDSLRVLIKVEKSDSFYSGNGQSMTQFSGDFSLYYKNKDEIKLDVTNGEGENDKLIKLESHTSISRTVGGGTNLILDDEFDVTGTGIGVDRNNENYTINISQNLKRKLQSDCASTFIIGEVNLKNRTSNIEMKIDFDPYNTKACDKLVKVTADSREFFFTVE